MKFQIAMADEPQREAHVSRTLSARKSRISLNGQVSVSSMQAITRCLAEAFEYYGYEEAEIEIDSPGGESRALNYLLEQVDHWRASGHRITTRGVVDCASAGALILAFGERGGRTVYQSTQVLFHFSRALLARTAVTADGAERLAGELVAVDKDMMARLLRHIFPESGVLREETARLMTSRLAWTREYLSTKCSDKMSNLFMPSCDIRKLARVFDGPDEELWERVSRHLAARFRADAPISLMEAYVLNLIDHVEGVTLAVEHPSPRIEARPLRLAA